MTVFDYLKDIIVHKKGNLPLDEYVPFLVTRWLSFINPEVCKAINNVNTKGLLEDKQMHYYTMLTLFPKTTHCPRISYIKRKKEDQSGKEDFKIKILAETLEISKQEAALLLNG